MNLNATAWLTLTVAALVTASPAAWPASKGGSSGGGGWGGGAAISPALQPDPTRGAQLADVAVNASGLAVAAWDQYTYNISFGATIGAAVQSGGRWGVPFNLDCLPAGGTCMNPRVAVGADGTIAVSWTQEDSYLSTAPQRRAQVAVRPAGSTTWTIRSLASGPTGGVAIPLFVPIAIDGQGNLTAAWNRWDGANQILQASTWTKAGGWSGVVTLVPGLTTYSPSVAVNARGDAAIAYTVSSCASCYMPYVAQYVSRASGTTGWSPPVNVSESMLPYGSGYITSPAVALDKQGLATVIYFGYGVEAVRQTSLDTATSAGKWTAPQTVLTAPTPTSSFGSFDLGLDDNGYAVVAASIFDATIGVDRSSVYVSRLDPSGGPTTLNQRLTDPAVPIDAYATRVAVSRDGTLAMVGWIDHYHGTVQVAQLSGGTASGGNVWNTTTIGKGTAFSSFQEILLLKAGSGTTARAVWKNAKSGTQWCAASYGK